MAAGGKRRSFYADLDHMRSLFDSVDASKTGLIGFKELCVLVQNIPGIEEAAVPELMDRLDRDKDGKVSFDDFEVLFAQEREEIKKKRKLNPSEGLSWTDSDISPYHHSTSETERDLHTAELLPSIQEIPVSPTITTPTRTSPQGDKVILRHKLSRRATLPARLDEPSYMSPIHPERQGRPPSSELLDLATQMRYMTDVSASPQLKRSSKVLSWISESGEMLDLEGTGQLYTSIRETGSDGLPSPPLSPSKGGDETSIFKAILESVCHTDKIGKEAIVQLCNHVKADPQEESELLALLSHLDKDKVGYVSLDEFVRGLQFIRNSAVVTSTPPPSRVASLRRTHSEFILPPYFSTPTSSHPPPAFLASTPLPTGTTYTTDSSGLLTVLDLNQSGVVKVDDLINQWQQLGVEAPHDTSLEDALNEVVTIDPAGRVNVGELATSLEGALLSEESKSSVLRQVALKLYKTEIGTLRSKVNHVSLERDTLRNSLNRTLEENKRLIKEGDEHADLVQQQSEQKLKETEAHLTDRLHKEKRSREEDARQMQERAAGMIKELEKKIKLLRREEDALRQNLKLQQDECNILTSDLEKANKTLDEKDRTIQMLQRDLECCSELGINVDGTHLSRLRELEDQMAEDTELITDLREEMTEMQDKYDLMVAENEKLKQKYLSQKRAMFRRSLPNDPAEVKKRHSTGDRPARPLSGSLFGRSRSNKPRLPPISDKLDLATEGSHHRILLEEDNYLVKSGSSQEMEEEEPLSYEKSEEVANKPISEESTPDEDEDFFARSTTSLMHELKVEEEKNYLEKKIDQLRKENAQLALNREELEQQLKNINEASQEGELRDEIEQCKHKQQELEKYISVLEKQRQNLSASQMEIVSQLAVAEETIAKQLLEITGLRSSQSNSDGKMGELVEELHHSQNQLEEEKSAHTGSISSLKQQLSNLEVYIDSQTEQCLKLEEEKARAEEDLITLEQQLMSEKKLNETRVKSLMQKLESLGKSHSDLGAKSEAQLKEMQTKLSNAYKTVKEFQEKSAVLKVQHAAAVKQETAVAKEVITVERDRSYSPDQSDNGGLKDSLRKLEADYTQLSQLNNQLQQDKVEMCMNKERLQTEIDDLQNQLSALEKELSDQSEVYMNEISRIKEDTEKEKEQTSERTAAQLAELHASLMKQMDNSTERYELKLKTLKQELKDGEDREKKLQDELAESGVQCRKLVVKVADLNESEVNWQGRVADLEYSQSQHLSEISELKEVIQRYQSKLERRVNFEEDVDFIPACSPNRSPFKSDSEAQTKLITQMKSRLEKLQQLLLKSTRYEDGQASNAELGLVKELLANNSALDSAAKQMREKFEAKSEQLSQSLKRKDCELKDLQSERNKERMAMEALATSNMQQLLGRMDDFHGNSNKSLDAYRARIEAVATMLESISASVHSQDKRHANTLQSVLSDLDKSQSEVCTYKEELERVRAHADHSHRYGTDQGNPAANELSVQNVTTETVEMSPSPESSKRRVDEGSGQLIDNSSEIDDTQSKVNLLQQKDNEIRALKVELDHAKKLEKHARTTIEELEKDLMERKRELQQRVDEVQQKDREIQTLEHKLSLVVNEPIEATVKYAERQPLERMNENVLTEMTPVMEEQRLKIKEQEEKIKELQEDLDKYLNEEKEVRKAMESAEAELIESRQRAEELKIENETKMKDLVIKHAGELSAAQSEVQSNIQEVKALYQYVTDQDIVTSNEDTEDDLTHSQLVAASVKEIELLKEQLKVEQEKSSDLEATLLHKMKEHDQLDAQFQAEHEEEVRALRQQKQQLIRQIEELKSHYQQLLNEHEKQNSMLLKDLENSKADIEKELAEKTEETYHVYQQVSDLMEEKKVLMDIVHQLCVEAGRQIDVV